MVNEAINEGDSITFMCNGVEKTEKVWHVSIDLHDGRVWYHTGRHSVRHDDVLAMIPYDAD